VCLAKDPKRTGEGKDSKQLGAGEGKGKRKVGPGDTLSYVTLGAEIKGNEWCEQGEEEVGSCGWGPFQSPGASAKIRNMRRGLR